MGYRKDRDELGMERVLKENAAEREVRNKFERVDEQRTKIRKNIDEIKADKSLTTVDREQRIKIEERRELDLMNEARQRLRDARTSRVPAAVPAAP
jgi:hypothetical protein